MAVPSALLLAISGPSSSGKTTLSRLLRDMLQPHAFILHEDDFYKTDTEIPVRDGLQDWDCVESLDLPLLHRTLAHVKQQGTLPTDFESKEDRNSVGQHRVPEAVVRACAQRLRAALEASAWARPIASVDGFLLFAESVREVREVFEVKLFLRAAYAEAKLRRERRMGYVTLEGFWEDPPGYVDKIVWPNYVKDHGFLFKEGNVEGEPEGVVCERLGLRVMPAEAQGSMEKVLMWSVDVLEEVLRSK